MKRALAARLVAFAACLPVLFGCNDDDDGGPASLPGRGGGDGVLADDSTEFFDDFSGSFPAPHWSVREGDPFTSPVVGHGAPGLALKPWGDRIRVRSAFEFSTAEPLTLSFDLATYQIQKSSRFKFKIRTADGGSNHATFEVRPRYDEVVVRILGSDDEINFDATSLYDRVEFSIDANRVATWSVNGAPLQSKGGFPAGDYKMEFETSGGDNTKFVADNVRLTRP
jgi:hypothetical protein